MKNYIAYYRVSTKQQGLGLDAQKTIVEAYVKNQGGQIVAEFSEKESGKETTHRTELQNAIKAHQDNNAVLVVAKLDRLSRNVADVFRLVKNQKNHIEVCGMDASDTMMLGIFATLAQKERELISERTKAALNTLKLQGIKLGSPSAKEDMKKVGLSGKGAETLKASAYNNEANKQAWGAIKYMPGSLRQKAEHLNSTEHKTPKGGKWTAMQVKRLIERFSQDQ